MMTYPDFFIVGGSRCGTTSKKSWKHYFIEDELDDQDYTFGT
tara:strand:- start:53 stop:178 length:126 start_codon:yes stop_codon:yes gene_type:complete